jgi:hypothetical protein
MQIRLKTLSIVAAIVLLIAFAVRAVVPQNFLIPGGWPLGSHWYHADWVAFWVLLIIGITAAMIVMIGAVLRSLNAKER